MSKKNIENQLKITRSKCKAFDTQRRASLNPGAFLFTTRTAMTFVHEKQILVAKAAGSNCIGTFLINRPGNFKNINPAERDWILAYSTLKWYLETVQGFPHTREFSKLIFKGDYFNFAILGQPPRQSLGTRWLVNRSKLLTKTLIKSKVFKSNW